VNHKNRNVRDFKDAIQELQDQVDLQTQDLKDLKAVLKLYQADRLSAAYDLANGLDTACRDLIPEEAFYEMSRSDE
jgi:hypothetical protein